jgi:SAM-dependent methyltransferase
MARMTVQTALYDCNFPMPQYHWLQGPITVRTSLYGRLFDFFGLRHKGATAYDLGCSLGARALALANRGYRVFAVDHCPVILEDLRRRIPPISHIDLLEADVCDILGSAATASADVICCMGDLLPLLPDTQRLTNLLRQAARVLQPGGTLLLEWQDLSGPLPSQNGFKTIRQDGSMSLSRLMEEEGDTILVHEKFIHHNGLDWQQTVRTQRKLRLSRHQMEKWALETGLCALPTRVHPLCLLAFTRTASA